MTCGRRSPGKTPNGVAHGHRYRGPVNRYPGHGTGGLPTKLVAGAPSMRFRDRLLRLPASSSLGRQPTMVAVAVVVHR